MIGFEFLVPGFVLVSGSCIFNPQQARNTKRETRNRKSMASLLLALFSVPQSQSEEVNPFISPIAIFLIFIVFYFFIIRPQQRSQKKKEKEKADMLEALKKGDKIITIGGIHGTVVQMGDTSVTIEIDKSARLRVEKSAIDRLE